MAHPDDDAPKSKDSHEIGQDLSLLSVDEPTLRIGILNNEIVRPQATIDNKRASRDAASNFFKS